MSDIRTLSPERLNVRNLKFSLDLDDIEYF